LTWTEPKLNEVGLTDALATGVGATVGVAVAVLVGAMVCVAVIVAVGAGMPMPFIGILMVGLFGSLVVMTNDAPAGPLCVGAKMIGSCKVEPAPILYAPGLYAENGAGGVATLIVRIAAPPAS